MIVSVRRPQGGLIVPSVAAAADVPRTWRVRARLLPRFFRTACLALLVTGMSGCWSSCVPAAGGGVDVMLLIDVSQSMRARDAAPDRLRAAISFARDVIARRPFDRFGIVLFAGRDALACPLTSDHEAVLLRLDAIEAGEAAGTALGEAIAGVLPRFPLPRQSAVLLVISDGISDADTMSPIAAAKRLRADGVRTVAAAIGRRQTAPFPTAAGLIDVEVDADETALRAAADAGHGVFVRADASGGAATVARFLDGLPSTRAPRQPLSSTPPWIGPAAVGLLLAELIVAVFVLKGLW